MFLGMQSQELPEFNVLGASATVLGNWPSSSADVERSFSLLSHIMTKERLSMRDDTFEYLVFLYVNKDFCMEGFKGHLTADQLQFLARASAEMFLPRTVKGTLLQCFLFCESFDIQMT